MILTKSGILDAMKEGDIKIEPFIEANLNPNSYDVTLGNTLAVYTDPILNVKQKPGSKEITMPENGFMLQPGRVYIAHTNEHTETDNLVPMLHGKSSLARLGIFVHITAGVGDVGFKGQWVLELVATQPVTIFPNMKIGQIVYHEVSGDANTKYNGKYVNQKGNHTSDMYKNF